MASKWRNVNVADIIALLDILSWIENQARVDLPGGESSDDFRSRNPDVLFDYCERLFYNTDFWGRMPDSFQLPETGRPMTSEELRNQLAGILKDCEGSSWRRTRIWQRRFVRRCHSYHIFATLALGLQNIWPQKICGEGFRQFGSIRIKLATQGAKS